MSKKSFKNNNPALMFITESKEYNTQEAQYTQEVQSEKNGHPTQGKKGKKLPRINMAFSPDNLEYLQTISRLEGVSITKYVNSLVERDKSDRADIVKKAKDILKG